MQWAMLLLNLTIYIVCHCCTFGRGCSKTCCMIEDSKPLNMTWYIVNMIWVGTYCLYLVFTWILTHIDDAYFHVSLMMHLQSWTSFTFAFWMVNWKIGIAFVTFHCVFEFYTHSIYKYGIPLLVKSYFNHTDSCHFHKQSLFSILLFHLLSFPACFTFRVHCTSTESKWWGP